MARGTSLVKLLDMLRSEARLSLNPAHNKQTRDQHVMLLQRQQQWLYDNNDWPHLAIERPTNLAAGQRYYAPPADIQIDRISHIEIRWGGDWLPMGTGIGRCEYSAFDSDIDERSWPVQKWAVYENDQIEVWPIPSDDADATTLEGQLKVYGTRKLRPLVADTDTADLDDWLIVLSAAAEILAASGAKDAQAKLQRAESRRKELLGANNPTRTFRMFGKTETTWRPRPPPQIHTRVIDR